VTSSCDVRPDAFYSEFLFFPFIFRASALAEGSDTSPVKLSGAITQSSFTVGQCEKTLYFSIPLPELMIIVYHFFMQLLNVISGGADHSGRVVKGRNCLRSLERWDRGFRSHCVYLFCVCVVLFVASGLATG
jgi:hypothetical protein